MAMMLFQIIVLLAILGGVWYLVSRFILPLLPQPVQVAINVILALIGIYILLSMLGAVPSIGHWRHF